MPSAPTPAAPTTPAPAPASESAAISGAQPTSSKRSALADSLVGIEPDDDSTPEQPAAPTFTPDPPTTPPPTEPTTPAGQSKLQTLQAKLLKDRQDREAKRAADEQSKHLAGLQKQLDESRQKPSMDQFVAEYSRAPVATLKKYGIDARKHLAMLTDDALAPGSLEAQAIAQDAKSDGQRALERVEQMERQQQARDEAAAGHRTNLDFLNVTSDAAKYPRLAALDNDTRLDLAMDDWRRLAAQGHPYDRDFLAELVEARLDKLHSSWAPPAAAPPPPTLPAPTTPSSPTSASPQSHAATNKPPKTITPALAGASSGTARRQTPKERREALANSLVAVESD